MKPEPPVTKIRMVRFAPGWDPVALKRNGSAPDAGGVL